MALFAVKTINFSVSLKKIQNKTQKKPKLSRERIHYYIIDILSLNYETIMKYGLYPGVRPIYF